MGFIDLIRTLGAQDTVACIGPSNLYERFGYFREAVSNICIAEPDPVRTAMLLRKIPAANHIHLFESAVLSTGRRAELKRYNYDELTTVGDTPALNALFPGLRETEQMAVDALSTSGFIGKLPQHHRGRDLLIIDSIGQEFDLLREVDKLNSLTRFSGLIVRIAKLPSVDPKSQSDQLHEWLKVRDFDRSIVLDGADPDLAIWYLPRNELGADLKQQRKLLESMRSEREAQRAVLEERTAALEKTSAAALKADSDLRVAIRLQTVAQNDLKDLQRQYSALSADKERQDKLLRQVTRKLAYASNHLHQLAADTPAVAELVDNASPDKKSRETSDNDNPGE